MDVLPLKKMRYNLHTANRTNLNRTVQRAFAYVYTHVIATQSNFHCPESPLVPLLSQCPHQEVPIILTSNFSTHLSFLIFKMRTKLERTHLPGTY